jgi:hypothetical protein
VFRLCVTHAVCTGDPKEWLIASQNNPASATAGTTRLMLPPPGAHDARFDR